MKLPKTYEPGLYEADIYSLWEKLQAFAPSQEGKPYSIVVPPPNANGNLHIGHALTLALEDIAVRYHRLKGERALLLPGADHAGFETQVVFERQLEKEGRSRFDLTREELYAQIWDFVAQNRSNFEGQLRRLGAGVDWNRFTFTLDEKITHRAYATFKKMWDEGLIYRGERLVNYCTFHRTSFADIEVTYEDSTTPLYYMKYGPFTLATTRPETKFGDTAVAVHPDDKRYKQYVGRVVTVEGVNGPFDVQVVADEMVDPNFGTGVVKITPAHSFDDWDVAQRHNLPAKRVINHDGTMGHAAGRFEGMTVMEARKAVVEALKEKGLLVKVDEHYKNRVGKCYKCGTVIEPMLMEQWFVTMQPLAQKAIKALKAGQITFYPQQKQTQLIAYLENLRDWNISRQVAWGIPIPAFQNVDDSDDWIYDENVGQEIIERDGKTYHRDPDVFDTWFSSGSWPYATLNFGDEKSKDFEDFYPLSLMETGFDILMPWVSRMLMLGLYVTGRAPFKAVYLHGLVLDEHGQKMSKSKGNVVNPLDIADEYGADALRMGLITGQSAGNNQPFGLPKVVGARNFCNKLWNIARYIEAKVGDDFRPETKVDPQIDADHWILSKLQQSTETIAAFLDEYRFAEAYEALYHFVWDDFADWYIEAAKAQPNDALLGHCLEQVLILAHPFAPFVTETIWQTLGWRPDALLATAAWPKESSHSDKKAVAAFEQLQTIVIEIRRVKSALGETAALPLLHSGDAFFADETRLALLKKLAHVSEVREGQGGLRLTGAGLDCRLDVDADTAARYKAKLQARLDETAAEVKRLHGRLANKGYVANAPEVVVVQTREQLAQAEARQAAAADEIARLG